MGMPLVLIDDDGIRPAGNPDKCFYCQQKVGTPHKQECVAVHKKIKAKYTFEIEVEIPFHWSPQDFEFHRNESSWCANNAVRDINELIKNEDAPCLCDKFEAEWID